MLARISRRMSYLFALATAQVLLPGCGESSGTVSGRVKFQGKELDGGYVVIQSEKNTASPPIRAKIGSDGSYSATGVPYGVNNIGVEPPPKALTSFIPKGIADKANVPGDKDAAKMYAASEGTYVDIPQVYRVPETSKIVVTVDSGR